MLVYEPWTGTMFTTDKDFFNEKLKRISERTSCMLRAMGFISLGNYLEEISDTFAIDIYLGSSTYEIGFVGSELVLKAKKAEGEREPVALETYVDGNRVGIVDWRRPIYIF